MKPMDKATVTWLGHASALIQLGTTRVLVDPFGRRRCRSVGTFDAILITHSHVDHLNMWTLRTLSRDTLILVPKGAKGIVRNLGFREVREVEPGDHTSVGAMDVHCVPTKHDNGRWRKGDLPICVGYILSCGGISIHHAGDIDMSSYEVFDKIGKDFQVDTTLLPIGGMLPVWYYRMRKNSIDKGIHIDPDTALEIAARLGATNLVPVHWGTLHFTGPLGTPKRRIIKVAKERNVDIVRILRHGESLELVTKSCDT